MPRKKKEPLDPKPVTRTRKKKPSKPLSSTLTDTSLLPEEVKLFITNKVRELGSVSATKTFYCLDDLVSKFALMEAQKAFPPEAIPQSA